ncbi:DsbA family oxidoreductase [Jiulongibacter sediminis]|uniref:DSBA-like thioredoxin domain-containing protein n=1 Tax=Jiulongibacter sediminis TaxID=1605367 RepID=A0A0P7C851_9BACT|nr:DsbA family oxidoreductase [Jiulongibacter sediminis]KPM48659.1 hypothetical protein AFM12_08640 [Jiulongibacter sediminis]TBX25196.1 hypothetical protein TK44_08645 [Jiulongibacter sediminis]
MKKKITVDVVSDVVCPWCYIGKRHLEKALEELPELEVEVNWHPFQLDPTVPEEGVNKVEHYTNKFGSMDRFEMLSQRVLQAGENAGIAFDFDQIERVPNTLKLHNLLHEAQKEGRATELKGFLLSSYFEKGKDLSSVDVIVELMEEFGWSSLRTLETLENQEASYWVKQEIRHYQNLGISGVPFFIINQKYGLSGAQPSEVFVEALAEVSNKIKEEEADACSIDDPNC